MSALSGLFDVIEHLVSTHPTWNQTLSKAEAFAKVQAAKVEQLAKDGQPLTSDIAQTVSDVTNLVEVGPEPTIADVEKAIADSEVLLAKLRDEK
jgi:hypothetical protein